jgi:hypothetical protein
MVKSTKPFGDVNGATVSNAHVSVYTKKRVGKQVVEVIVHLCQAIRSTSRSRLIDGFLPSTERGELSDEMFILAQSFSNDSHIVA